MTSKGRSGGKAGRALAVAAALGLLVAAAPLFADSINYNPASPNVDQNVSFQYMPTGGVKNSIRWNFGDGTVFLSPGGVLTASHAYAAAGTYTVQAQVQLVGSVAPVIRATVRVVERRSVTFTPPSPSIGQPVSLRRQQFPVGLAPVGFR